MIQTGVDATIFNMQTSSCLYCLIDDHSVSFYYSFMISSNIAALRKKHRWTQEALANKVGVSRQTIAKWEAPGGNPDISSISELMKQEKIPTNVEELLYQLVRERAASPLQQGPLRCFS